MWAEAAAVCARCPTKVVCLTDCLVAEGDANVRHGFRGGAAPTTRKGLAILAAESADGDLGLVVRLFHEGLLEREGRRRLRLREPAA